MESIEKIFEIIEKLVGTPLYLLMGIGMMVFFVYYFWKVAPARYAAFENLVKDNTRQSATTEKLVIQYEKTLENSNRVIENNTAALKSTQSMLELFNSKIDTAIQKEEEIHRSTNDLNDKINDFHITVAVMKEKLEQIEK